MNEQINKIEARLSEIKNELETRKDLKVDEMDKLNKETEDLIKEKANIVAEARQKALSAFNSASAISLKDEDLKAREERAKKFASTNRLVLTSKEQRAALLSSGKIAKPTAVDGIYDNTFGELGLLNEVVVKNYAQNETITHAYTVSGATASDHTEGNSPTESEPVFDTIKVQPKAISLISYVSRAIRRTSPLDYEAAVRSSAESALRLKSEDFIIKQIPTCTNTTGTKLATEVTLTEQAIGEKTLRNIVLKYRPGRRFQGIATLYLTRDQLIAFGDVRGTNEKRAVYEITPDANNMGGILRDGGLSVRYRIVAGLTDMLYGYLSAFEFDTFGDYVVEVSEDYKFAEGLLAIRGEAWIGGSLTCSNAFEVVKLTPKA